MSPCHLIIIHNHNLLLPIGLEESLITYTCLQIYSNPFYYSVLVTILPHPLKPLPRCYIAFFNRLSSVPPNLNSLHRRYTFLLIFWYSIRSTSILFQLPVKVFLCLELKLDANNSIFSSIGFKYFYHFLLIFLSA